MKTNKKKKTATSSFGSAGRVNHDSTEFYNSNLYKDLGAEQPIETDNELPAELTNKIIQATSEAMTGVPNNCLHLMITSPPYNVSKDYDDNLTLEDYLALLERAFKETHRVLVNGGRACINIANVGRKPYIPLSDYVSRLMIDIGFKMRGEIIWNKASSAGVSCAWGSWKSANNPVLRDIHEYILVFSKGSFSRKSDHESTINKEQFIQWTKSIWDMTTVSAKKIGHPAPFPLQLPERLIQLYSYKSDVVLDPFMGSGTTAIAAAKAGRRYLGYEVSAEYVSLAQTRIKAALEEVDAQMESQAQTLW